jgi:hypothetical protein
LIAFLLHHFSQPILNEVISKQIVTFGIHFAITSKIGEKKFVNWHWLCSYVKCVRIATFNVDCGATPKWFKSNKIIIKEFSWTLFL